ncbi:permease [Patescibacteria group bacterium]|nr:permease [Patescibacteria group bacterium]
MIDIFSPLQAVADLVTYRLLTITQGSYWGNAVNFFVYDVLKIGLLLLVINYLMAITRYYFPMEKVRDLLTKRRWFGLDYLLAAVLGMVTPFCSCSSIPLFIGFVGAGIPLGVTFAFLIASPLINESSLFLFPALFGWKVSLLYNLMGIGIAVLGGLLIQKLHLEKYIEPSLLKFKNRAQVVMENQGLEPKRKELLKLWWEDGFAITKKIYPYVILGVAVGAIIHGFVPQTLIEKYLGMKAWWSVPAATLLGVPLYANSVSIIPVMEALVGKGVPMGTALAFMTATVTLSIPEALILKKAMKWPLLLAFFGITVVGIMVMSYLFNVIKF